VHRILPFVLLACDPTIVVLDTDGGVIGDARRDDAILATDGPVSDGPPLTLCEEARMHSDFVWLEQRVFAPFCATMGCHTGANAEVDLRLDPGYVRANLVNRGTSTVSGWIRVVPGSTATSYLVVALGRTAGPPPRDGFMPLGSPALCVEIHEALERWISAGAP
jgi:hypothetical protein